MARDIDWKMKRDDDGTTYDVRVVRFSGKFKFQFREHGASHWDYKREPQRPELEYFLDLIQRRYRRREATWKEVQLAEALLKALGRREAEEAAAIARAKAAGAVPVPSLTEEAEELLADSEGDTIVTDFQDVSAAFAKPVPIAEIKERLQAAATEEVAPTKPKLTTRGKIAPPKADDDGDEFAEDEGDDADAFASTTSAKSKPKAPVRKVPRVLATPLTKPAFLPRPPAAVTPIAKPPATARASAEAARAKAKAELAAVASKKANGAAPGAAKPAAKPARSASRKAK
ncbi:hypothetical protein DB346_09955 [Verrucomicrobia bacterium LW23]|nr:hypothetical protein DB346_09955 [Verrucomicrobia bacterium LW23]